MCHLMTAVPCFPSTPVPSICCKGQTKQLSISNQHVRVSRWSAFNFTQVSFQCVLGMPSNTGNQSWILKKHVCKKYWFSKKNLFTNWIWTTSSWIQVSWTTHWAISAAVFDGKLLKFSPLLHLQPAVERNLIIAFTRSDKLEVGGWWFYDVGKLIWQYRQSQVSYRHDGQTDGWLFSFIYID